MRIIIHDMAHDSIDNIIEYLANYSITSPTEIIEEIYKRIYFLENYSYIGRYIPEMSDTHFREIIYKNHDILDIELCITYVKLKILSTYLI